MVWIDELGYSICDNCGGDLDRGTKYGRCGHDICSKCIIKEDVEYSRWPRSRCPVCRKEDIDEEAKI